MSRVRSSQALMKPGAPPRGDASGMPLAPLVATTTKGVSSMKRRLCFSSADSCLRIARGLGSP